MAVKTLAVTIALLALLAGCGGGGSPASSAATTAAAPTQTPSTPDSAAPPPTGTTAPAPAPAPSLSANVVAWGDSLTPAFALNLQVLYPERAVANEGFLGATSTAIASNELADTEHRGWINVFWYGQNNDTDPETIKADIARSIAHLAPGNDRFIVLGVVNKADDREKKGTPAYATIVKLNQELAALYPANFIDMRAWLVAHYNPGDAGEVEDHDADIVPRSLRYDEIHLRNEGSVLVAQRVKQFIDAKGW